jgi:hypothetical protein
LRLAVLRSASESLVVFVLVELAFLWLLHLRFRELSVLSRHGGRFRHEAESLWEVERLAKQVQKQFVDEAIELLLEPLFPLEDERLILREVELPEEVSSRDELSREEVELGHG